MIFRGKVLDKIGRYCEKSDNIVFDNSNFNYYPAYRRADAIITDCDTGVLFTGLPLGKPIGVMYRNDRIGNSFNTELLKSYYSVAGESDLYKYLDMVRCGEDPMKERRLAAKEKYIKYFDGKNGERIKDMIMRKFEEMENLNQ